MFHDPADLTIEKLPMIFVIYFNEQAKKENVTLDTYLTMLNINLMNKRNKNRKLAGPAKTEVRLGNLVFESCVFM